MPIKLTRLAGMALRPDILPDALRINANLLQADMRRHPGRKDAISACHPGHQDSGIACRKDDVAGIVCNC
ncbi:MAG: hypothetical protein PHY54_07630 [Methylococcales bacterium]|nr:hypothetical protein [Methylococcales bacterium]